jgi:hypothetical protein
MLCVLCSRCQLRGGKVDKVEGTLRESSGKCGRIGYDLILSGCLASNRVGLGRHRRDSRDLRGAHYDEYQRSLMQLLVFVKK